MHDDRLVLHARRCGLRRGQAGQGRDVAEEDLLALRDAHDLAQRRGVAEEGLLALRDAHDVTHELAYALAVASRLPK